MTQEGTSARHHADNEFSDLCLVNAKAQCAQI